MLAHVPFCACYPTLPPPSSPATQITEEPFSILTWPYLFLNRSNHAKTRFHAKRPAPPGASPFCAKGRGRKKNSDFSDFCSATAEECGKPVRFLLGPGWALRFVRLSAASPPGGGRTGVARKEQRTPIGPIGVSIRSPRKDSRTSAISSAVAEARSDKSEFSSSVHKTEMRPFRTAVKSRVCFLRTERVKRAA